MKKQIDINQARELFFAGNALLTVEDKKTAVRFTYRIVQKQTCFQVSLEVFGNQCGYSRNMGVLYLTNLQKFYRFPDSKISSKKPARLMFNKLLFALLFNHPFRDINVYHNGFCCRCGQKLTSKKSIHEGIGPECSKINESEKQRRTLRSIAVEGFLNRYANKARPKPNNIIAAINS